MDTKFDGLEADATIIFATVAKFGVFDAKYEKWYWDGIYGESLIFYNPDISETSGDELEADIMSSSLVDVGSKITVKISEPYTFFNFFCRRLYPINGERPIIRPY